MGDCHKVSRLKLLAPRLIVGNGSDSPRLMAEQMKGGHSQLLSMSRLDASTRENPMPAGA